uniref:GGDEF domain-containing protein n=1 Tax=Idiomarina sp. TaxID=1874361 RepID=UPI00258CD4CE
KVNDNYGHDAGDEVLQHTARKIAGLVRISDCVSRVGGEEFALLLTDLPREKAERVLEKVRTAIEGNAITIDKNQSIKVTVSIGATELKAEDEFNSAYKKADLALYKSKRDGRNRVSWSSN